MRKIFRIILAILIVVFLAIQFFQPEKNISDDFTNHILNKENLPENIQVILRNSCLDCHSNNTEYKWYHKPAPVSWMINKHITNGKEELNFSDWGTFDIIDKIGILEKICNETERKTMPLKSYTAIHKKAKLTDEQIAELCAWTEQLSTELLHSFEN